MRLITLLLLTFALAACAEPPYANINNDELKTLMAQGVPVYDVRRVDEWQATGVVAGSHKLTFVDKSGQLNPEFLPRFSAAVSKDTLVILICRSGNRTDKLGRELVALGYTQIYNVRNGISRWISENNPVIKN
jgi:rhodanese-related sulfurtransferase